MYKFARQRRGRTVWAERQRVLKLGVKREKSEEPQVMESLLLLPRGDWGPHVGILPRVKPAVCLWTSGLVGFNSPGGVMVVQVIIDVIYLFIPQIYFMV